MTETHPIFWPRAIQLNDRQKQVSKNAYVRKKVSTVYQKQPHMRPLGQQTLGYLLRVIHTRYTWNHYAVLCVPRFTKSVFLPIFSDSYKFFKIIYFDEKNPDLNFGASSKNLIERYFLSIPPLLRGNDEIPSTSGWKKIAPTRSLIGCFFRQIHTILHLRPYLTWTC